MGKSKIQAGIIILDNFRASQLYQLRMPDSPPDFFVTIAGPAQSMYKEKSSKFIGLAYTVTTEAEIKEILTGLKKEYYDARHHCYAYVLGAAGDQYRANDDGEPNHSAGDPILGQIRSAKLTNILVVVVRYFGGTKLGVSGLVQAYKTAAAEAIAAATPVKKTITTTLEIAFTYAHMNSVMALLKELKSEIITQQFTAPCIIAITIKRNMASRLLEKFKSLPGITVQEVTN